MTSVTRSNSQGTGGAMSRTTHQRRMHKLMVDNDYEFTRHDARGHNTYVNRHGQHISVPGTPKNEGHSARFLKQEIIRQRKQRENGMPVATEVKPADVYLALADPFLMTPPKAGDKRAADARSQAFQAWVKRVVEKYGPVPGAALTEAAERIGYNRAQVHRARANLNVLSYNAGGQPSVWMACFDYQLPEGHERRNKPHEVKLGVDPIEPEPTKLEAGISNGKHAPTDQQAAFLLLAEQLGMSLPDNAQARNSLEKAREALMVAQSAVDFALESLS